MKKIVSLLAVLILLGCSSNDDSTQNKINPSQFMIGHWTMKEGILEYIITEHDILEINNNYLDVDPNDPRGRVDFANDFNDQNYVVTEISLNDTYELMIDTRDGEPDPLFGFYRIYRRFSVKNVDGEERVYVTYQGASGLPLYKVE